MKTTQQTNIINWDDHLDRKYGKAGTPTREKYAEDFETFKIGALIQEARRDQNLTQEELALRVGTTRNDISRVENDAGDIRLTTLMKIIHKGLGGQLTLNFSV